MPKPVDKFSMNIFGDEFMYHTDDDTRGNLIIYDMGLDSRKPVFLGL